MTTLNKEMVQRTERPIKVLQYGEGNFLRAFVDYMLDIANEKGVFDGNIAIVKPISFGSTEMFHKQDNLYTVVLRGKENGKTVNDSRVITSVSAVLDCKEDYDAYMSYAEGEDLRFVVSNTTEAGIVLDEKDHFEGLPDTYPGKLTKFLYHRFETFNGAMDKGLIMLPVELIENNGGKLKECVLSLCDIWSLPNGFKNWIQEACIFCSTLVDRIVTGYPRGEVAAICEELGYEDNLVDVGEQFGLWVIESDKDISRELPLDKAGLPVVFTHNQKPYRERKVRVLNGAHTASVLAGYLYGLDIVRDCMHDDVILGYMNKMLHQEIIPTLPLDKKDLESFASAVADRFNNPFIDHEILSISLNSTSKWLARNFPSFIEYVEQNGTLPTCLTMSFAAYIAFFTSDIQELNDKGLVCRRAKGNTYTCNDDRWVLEFYYDHRNDSVEDLVHAVMTNEKMWGQDLTKIPGFEAATVANLTTIRAEGAHKAYASCL